MICSYCGATIADDSRFCAICGHKLEAPAPLQQPVSAGYAAPADNGRVPTGGASHNAYPPAPGAVSAPLNAPAPIEPGLSRRAYYNQCASPAVKKQIKSSVIMLYLSAGATLVLYVILGKNPFGMIDVLLLAGLAVGLQLLISRVCAISALALALFNVVVGLVETGQFTGWLILLAGVYAVIATFAFQKEWNAYQQATRA